MNELQFLIDMNATHMKNLQAEIQTAMGDLNTIVEGGQVGGYAFDSWTQGHVAQKVAEMCGLVTRQRALLEAQHAFNRSK